VSGRADERAVSRLAGPLAIVSAILLVGGSRSTTAQPVADVTQGHGDPSDQAGIAQARVTYELVDTWSNVPWQAAPGHLASVVDIASAPGGTTYVLDAAHRAIHVFDAAEAPIARWTIAQPLAAQRLDAGADGGLAVLGGRGPRQAVQVLAADGTVRSTFDPPSTTDTTYADIARFPDGRVALLAPAPDGGTGNRVDVFDARGLREARIDLDGLFAPDACARLIAKAADVEPGGRLYIATGVDRTGCAPPATAAPPGGPSPTPRPSGFLSHPRLPAQPGTPTPSTRTPTPPSATPTPPPGPRPRLDAGVLVFDRDLRLRDFVPGPAEDVAASAAGAVVLDGEDGVCRLGEGRPRWRVRSPRLVDAAEPVADPGLPSRLAVADDGRPRLARDRCFTRAVVAFGDPAAPAAEERAIGVSDAPRLEGPVAPLRLAAGNAVYVLEASVRTGGSGGEGATVDAFAGPEVVRRWSGARPTGQWHLCGPRTMTVDVAGDGAALFAIEPHAVRYRPDDLPPAWALGDPGAYFVAGDADGGRLAVLDAGRRRVRVLDRGGATLADWPLDGGGGRMLPVDIALHGDRVYLADSGRSRVEARRLDGTPLGGWSTHDGPRRIAAGPDGTVFVLSRGGWGLAYAPGGALAAAWPLPERSEVDVRDFTVEARDIAVDDAGRVYVAFMGLEAVPPIPPRTDWGLETKGAGVWVFERVAAAAPLPAFPAREACLARPAKAAAPARLPLGGEVTVTLDVAGACPAAASPLQVLVVLDTSHSMNWNKAMDRAKATLVAWLGGLDLDNVQVGLVTFGDGAALDAPLARDLGAVRARVAVARADGDTRMGAGLALALAELTGPRREPTARQIAVVVSDGIFKDDPAPEISAARAAGVELAALLYTTHEFDAAARDRVARLFGPGAKVHIDLPAVRVDEVARDLAVWQPVDGLFESVVADDVIPPNMRYVPNSAVPPAAFDRPANRLRWTLGAVRARDGLRLSYRLQPLAPGTWPTNVEAAADYRDAFGFKGRLVFPIPQVEVYVPPTPTPTPTPVPGTIHLPLVLNRGCLPSWRPLDVVLVIDTSSSMDQPAPGGGTKLDAARAAARMFVDLAQLPRDRVAVVMFDQGGRTLIDLSGDRAAIHRALDGLATRQGTRIDQGLAQAAAVLAAGRRPQALATVVLLTDGRQGEAVEAVAANAAALKSAGAVLYTLGLGADIDAALLRAVASSPDRFLVSPTAAELDAIYRQVLVRIECEAGPGG